MQYRWFKPFNVIVFDQTSNFAIFDQKNVILRFEINFTSDKEETDFKKLHRIITLLKSDALGKIYQPLDKPLTGQELIYLSNKLRFLDFKPSDIETIKMRLKRDFYFFCRN